MTKPEEFKLFHSLVQHLDPWYIPLEKNKKSPDLSVGSWKKVRLDFKEAFRILKVEGRNVGIVAEERKILIVDLDVKFANSEGYPSGREKVLKNLLSILPPTLTVKTQSGGYHLYYLPGEDIPNFDFVDSVDPDTNKNVHMGEVRANVRYVLVPGSEINGNGYTVVDPMPPAKIRLSDFPKRLLPEQVLSRSPSAQGETEARLGDQPASLDGKFFNRWGWSLDDIVYRQPKLAVLLTQELPEGYISTSEADQALANILWFWEFGYETYKQIMYKYRSREDKERPGQNRLERGGYLKRTWESAKRFSSKNISQLLKEQGLDPNSWSPRFRQLPVSVADLSKQGIELKIKDPVDDKWIEDWLAKLPDGHFLREYYKIIKKRSDTYPEYILTSGLFAVSIALAGNVKIPLTISRLDPNVYALMLGVSGYSRKTTTMRYLNTFLEHSTLIFNKGPDDMSPEGLVASLSSNPKSFFIWDEFGGLLATMKKTWGSGLSDLLMKLYEGETHKRRLRSKEYVISSPYVCILSGTTPARLYKESDDSLVLSGFYPRFLIVSPQREKEFKPVGIDYAFDDEVQRIGGYLDSIHTWVEKSKTLYGQPVYATFTQEGMDIINGIMMDIEKKVGHLQDMDKDIESEIWSRYQHYVTKIAVLLKFSEASYLVPPAVSGTPGDNPMGVSMQVEVPVRYLELARELVETMYYPYAKRVIYDILLAAEKSSFNKVVRLLKKYKKLKWSDLLRRSHITAREFREVVDTLEQRQDVILVDGNVVWVGGD